MRLHTHPLASHCASPRSRWPPGCIRFIAESTIFCITINVSFTLNVSNTINVNFYYVRQPQLQLPLQRRARTMASVAVDLPGTASAARDGDDVAEIATTSAPEVTSAPSSASAAVHWAAGLIAKRAKAHSATLEEQALTHHGHIPIHHVVAGAVGSLSYSANTMLWEWAPGADASAVDGLLHLIDVVRPCLSDPSMRVVDTSAGDLASLARNGPVSSSQASPPAASDR